MRTDQYRPSHIQVNCTRQALFPSSAGGLLGPFGRCCCCCSFTRCSRHQPSRSSLGSAFLGNSHRPAHSEAACSRCRHTQPNTVGFAASQFIAPSTCEARLCRQVPGLWATAAACMHAAPMSSPLQQGVGTSLAAFSNGSSIRPH